MPLGTRNWGGTEYHDSIFDPESQPQEYEQPYVESFIWAHQLLGGLE